MTTTFPKASSALPAGRIGLPSGAFLGAALVALAVVAVATVMLVRPATAPAPTDRASVEQALIAQRAGERESGYGITSQAAIDQALVDHRAAERASAALAAQQQAYHDAMAQLRETLLVRQNGASSLDARDDAAAADTTEPGSVARDDAAVALEKQIALERFRSGWSYTEVYGPTTPVADEGAFFETHGGGYVFDEPTPQKDLTYPHNR